MRKKAQNDRMWELDTSTEGSTVGVRIPLKI